MARLLIRLVPPSHVNPSGCYEAGMPVVVFEDGHVWGREECPPIFTRIDMPGVPAEKVRKYLEPYEDQDGFEDDGITPKFVMIRKRLWRFRIEALPLAARNKLAAGLLTIGPSGDYTWTQVKNYLRNLRTGLDETADL